LESLKSPKKGVGSGVGSGFIRQRYGSGDLDPDPHQNVTDPQHCFLRRQLDPHGVKIFVKVQYVRTVRIYKILIFLRQDGLSALSGENAAEQNPDFVPPVPDVVVAAGTGSLHMVLPPSCPLTAPVVHHEQPAAAAVEEKLHCQICGKSVDSHSELDCHVALHAKGSF
jgi:hypothetical protein